MRERLRKVYFGFSLEDRQAALDFLQAQADEGWELVKLKQRRFSWAYFRPLDGPMPRYGVDIADYPLKSWEEKEAYIRLLADAGWEPVGQMEYMAFYRAAPDRDPAPIQTDPELERKRYWQEVRKPTLWGLLAVAAILALAFWALSSSPGRPFRAYYLLSSNAMLFVGAELLILLLWGLWGLVLRLLRLHRKRRAGSRYQKLPGQLLGCGVSLLSYGVLLLSLLTVVGRVGFSDGDLAARPVVYAQDLGLNGGSPWGGDRAGSPLLESFYVRESLDQGRGGYLYQERLQCRFPWVAALVVDGLRRDEAGGFHQNEVFVSDPGSLTPMDLGFDEAYVSQHEKQQCLLLRQGNVVVLLEGPVDFTSPQALPVLWDGLDLEVTG